MTINLFCAMIKPMIKHDRDPNLTHRFDRRAKLAAYASSLGLLAAMAGEAALAQPAAAMDTVAAHETQNPNAYLAKVDGELIKIMEEVEAAPDTKHMKGIPGFIFSHSKRTPTEGYSLVVPNKGNPSHHDILGVTVAKGARVPVLVSMTIDYESNPTGVIRKAPGMNYVVNPTNDDALYSEKSVNLLVTAPTSKDSGLFRVGTSRSRMHPTEYLDNPKAVSTNFDTFFHRANSIIDASR